LIEAASRRERAAQMRREVLRMDPGQPDGGNVAEELARDRLGPIHLGTALHARGALTSFVTDDERLPADSPA
jgi:hypothetical protein